MSRTRYALIAIVPAGASSLGVARLTAKAFSLRGWSMRFVLTCLLSILPVYTAAAKNTTYKNPRYYSNHLPIDYCLLPTKQCGHPAADKFCKDMNAGSVISFKSAPANSGTYIQGNGEICDTKKYSQCNAFTEIVCGSYTY